MQLQIPPQQPNIWSGGVIHTLAAEMGMGGGHVPMIITIKKRDGTTTYI